MWDAIVWLIKLVIPPVDSDPAHQYRWRLTVALLLLTIILGDTIHIALECGYFKPFYAGFALESDFMAANNKLDNLLDGRTEDNILLYKEKLCAANKSQDPDAGQVRSFAMRTLQDGLLTWQQTHNGMSYPLPNCPDMGL